MNIGTLTIEMAANVARLSKDMDTARRTVERTFGSIERDVARLKGLLGGLFAGLSASAFVGKLVDVQRQFDVLNSSLVTVTGSSAAAAREFAWIKEFAATTPYQLAEVTGAFVKMKALGLDASMEALRSYGNTASAMGKSLNQMIEAVADAATSQFERLKEFGIKAKQQGDQVTFTFQGVSKTIGNNAAEITAYLQAIGENEFAGAMAQRMNTLDGAISNLADTWDELFRTISQQSVGGLIYDSVKLASGAIEDMIAILNALNGATAENARQTGAMKVIQEGIAIVFETVAVLGVNLKYVLVQIGREIGGIAAQAAAILRGDFAQAGEIRRMMIADAEAARKEVDATTARILNARKEAQAATAANAAMAQSAAPASRAAATVASSTKKANDELEKFIARMNASEAGVESNFYKNLELLRDAYNKGKLSLEEYQALAERYIKSQKFYQDQVKQSAAAEEERRRAVERAAEEHAKAIQSAEEMVEQIQFEAKALKMTNTEREIAIKLRELERRGIKAGTAEYEAYARRIRDAIVGKEAIEASIEQQRRAREEWQRVWDDVSRSFVDALMEGGKSVKEYLVNLFRTMVLRPILQPIVGGVVGALGLGGMSSAVAAEPGSLGAALGLSNAVSTIKGVYDTVMGGFASLGNSVAFAAQDIGAWLVQNTTGILNNAGATLMQSAGSLGTFASYAGGIATGYGLGNLIGGKYAAFGNANVSNVAGTAIGAILGGPIGAAIGGAIGGLVNRAFGRGPEKVTSSGIRGTFSASGADVLSYTNTNQKGGWFRSSKSRTYTNPVQAELEFLLDSALVATAETTKRYASLLGMAAEAVDGFSQAIDISLHGLSPEDQEKRIAEALSAFGDAMVSSLYAEVTKFSRFGETAGETMARLATSLQTVNSVFDVLGLRALDASAAMGDAASSLLDLFGGAEKFVQATDFYYQNFYTEAERAAKTIEQLTEAFAGLGLQLPASRAAFRSLVEAAREAGDKELFARLLALAPAFASVSLTLEEAAVVAQQLNGVMQESADVLRERASLEARLLQLLRDTAALRARELASVDESNRGILERIYAIEDARAATDAAYSALERAIDAQRTSVTAMRDAAREQVDSVTAVFDVLKSNIKELYNEAASTSAMSAAAGQAFIVQALETARSTGYLPDSDELAQAIRAARGGLDSNRYTSAFEAERDRLVLAGRLSQLREISGTQLTTAERQLRVAEQQLESLDGQLATARAQLDAMRGVDRRVLSVEQAIRELNAAMAAELRALGGALGSARNIVPPVESLSSPSEAARAGYITSPVNEYGSYTGIGDSGYRLVSTPSGATLHFPGGGSHSVSGPEAAQLLADTYGLIPGGLNGTLVRTRAQGGYTPPGLTLVGEEGPELINFRSPGMVYTAAETSNLLRGDNSELIDEVRQLREENQAQARAMVQLQARVTRLLERWDGDGMPETRSVTA